MTTSQRFSKNDRLIKHVDATKILRGKHLSFPKQESLAMYRLDKLSNSPYSSSLSGEALRLREMRMLARLKLAGKTDSEITQVITSENSFQYNVRSRYTKKVLRYGLERLKALDSKDLVKVVSM